MPGSGVGVLRDVAGVGVPVSISVAVAVVVSVDRTSGVYKAIPMIENFPAARMVSDNLVYTVKSRTSPGTCGAPVHTMLMGESFTLSHS